MPNRGTIELVADNSAFLAVREREYPWMASSETIYLDHASTGASPLACMNVQREYARLRHQPTLLRGEHFFDTLTAGRVAAAKLIGADPTEIALTTNTSHGLNLAAFALPLAAGDEILTVAREFPANVFPWLHRAARSGATLHTLPCVDDIPDQAALLDAIATRPRVKIVALSWVSFCSGARLDLDAIGAACRARGVYLVVDAIQGLGALPLDVAKTPIDILATGAQKWLQSPWGTGFVYVRQGLIEQLEPPSAGWLATVGSTDVSSVVDGNSTWYSDARRFEVGTISFADVAGMTASLGVFAELGVENIAEHLAALGDLAVTFADEHRELQLVTPRARAQRAGIFAFQVENVAAASEKLRARGVAHALREGCLRLAPHWYTTTEEWTRALTQLIAL